MPRKVLVVEEDVPTGQILSERLVSWGLQPTLLGHGEGTLAWARLHRPDVVVVEQPQASTNGFDFGKELKLAPETGLIPLVTITSPAVLAPPVHGLFVQANSYLIKPFTEAQLQHTLGSVFAWSDEAQRLGIKEAISFLLSSDFPYLEELIAVLTPVLDRAGLAQPQVRNLITAIREIGTNAIEWGHQKRVEQIVTVDYRRDLRAISIRIRDSGPGFNPTNLPHAAREDDPIAHLEVRESLGLRQGGFGIMMARGLVDKLTYNETGNEVHLVKYLTPPDAVGPASARNEK
jgi:anti-sigma regulatory factor (Ser/Thr protein kinase)